MALKNIFNVMKNEGVLIPAIDSYLLTLGQDEDRHHDYVSPSSVHNCLRSQMYRILGEKNDGANAPKLQRIFDTGTDIHTRTQDYLSKAGILEIPECPIFLPEYRLTGHTDGILKINKFTRAILEIKSINSDGFKNLRQAKDDHVKQASAYMFGVETLRQKCMGTALKFKMFKKKYLKEYEDFMDGFVTSGKKYTKEQKIKSRMEVMEQIIDILRDCPKPIDTIYFLYMNKDTQEYKEYVVKWDEEAVKAVKDTCNVLKEYYAKKELPPRPEGATGKSCGMCRYCNFKGACYK